VLRQLPEFYGQHEIAELAKQKEDLTALLRRFLSAKAVAATDRKQATQRALAETRDRLLKLDQEIATADERLDKLSALEVRLAEFNRLGLPARLAANTRWLHCSRRWKACELPSRSTVPPSPRRPSGPCPMLQCSASCSVF
jgi:hypothetical protein